ncbi:MAG: ATP-binding cassette domain-containing protein [Lachnospiraceae bacterium]|nr:ATP-binding cassette domain-containing protein [Lachnospiraceae bacterium]
MNTKSNLTDKEGAKELENVRGNIVIKDVSFTYKNYDSERNDEGNSNSANNKKEEKQIKEKRVDEKYIEKTKKDYVLKNINLNINEGETVALVGPSGGGKTTLAQLILRFYDTAVGEILIDNQNVKDITQESLHKNIGVVQQDVFLFPATIEENIRYGKPNATLEEVIDAAKMAEVYDDIMHMPEGFNSYVGDRGVLLSGGQKQRISIARIFLKNPKILILDEATSALDSVTEFKIQKTFDKLSKGRTTIVIAHRLSTVKNADRIVVIENGMIEEMGTHDELINKNGIFAKLVSSQEL